MLAGLRGGNYGQSSDVSRGGDTKTSLPPLAWAWVIGGHLLVVAWATAAVVAEDYTHLERVRCGLLSLCALAHVVLTLEAEERRRGASVEGGSQHIDQTSVWTFVAALVLPVPAALVVLVVVRVAVFAIARRPLLQFVFSTSSIGLSMLGAHALATQTPLREYLTGHQLWQPGEDVAVALGVLAAAVVTYFLVQLAMVGVVVGLATHDWSPVNVLGERSMNQFALVTLVGASGAAVMQSVTPWMLVLAVPVVVASTRDKQRVAAAEAEHASLIHDALHDTLTRLPIRAKFDPLTQLTLADDQQRGRGTALLLVDIDEFKQWNSTYGLLGGDRVLVGVADVLRSVTRHGDLLCRRGGSGGDEMIALLPGAEREHALSIAERIRADVEQAHIEVTQPAGGRTVVLGEANVPGPTVSVGVALSPDDGWTLEELEAHADCLLRQAKRRGRNQVVPETADTGLGGWCRTGFVGA